MLLIMLVVGVDALRFHRAELGAPLALLLAFEALTTVVLVGSLLRQALRQRALLRRLPASPRHLHGISVLLVPSRRPLAFCAGLVRPRIVVSDGLIELLSDRELLSVLAHERHHARRRDPLRRALAQAISDAFWFIPAFRTTADTQMTISELAADAVAARSAGVQPLASALVTFEDHGGPGAGGHARARPPARRPAVACLDRRVLDDRRQRDSARVGGRRRLSPATRPGRSCACRFRRRSAPRWPSSFSARRASPPASSGAVPRVSCRHARLSSSSPSRPPTAATARAR